MDKKVVFEIGDLYNNAGLVGFVKVLENLDKYEKYYEINEDNITVDKEFLLNSDLTKAVFDTYIKTFYKDLKYTKILNEIDLILKKINENCNIEDIKDLLKNFKNDLIGGNKFKTGYEIISNKIKDTNNILEKVKNITVKKEIGAIKSDLLIIQKYLIIPEVKETMYMKDIAYGIIDRFWNNRGFLLRANAKKDMKESHYKSFEEPLKQQLNNTKTGKNYCSNCLELTSNLNDHTFVNGMGDDFKKKTSVFWNFKQDKGICAKCMFLYSLIPLGFTKNGRDFIFINNNTSVDALINMNNLKLTEESSNIRQSQIYNQIISKYLHANENKLDNIEVANIYSDEEKCNLDIINRYQLELIRKSSKDLEFLAKSYDVRINGNYVNIYKETVIAILKNLSIYKILNRIIEASVRDKNSSYFIWFMKPLLNIIINRENIIRKDEIMEKETYFAGKDGASILAKIKATGQDDSYVIGITYKLLNALRKEAVDDFLDIVIRLCNSLKINVPTCFINNMNDKEKFKAVGYAFLIGLRGGIYSKENKEGDINE